MFVIEFFTLKVAFKMKTNFENIVFELKNVAVSFGSKTLWEDISFEIKKGDFIAIAGINGSGKTTLIKCLAGLNQNYKGDILFYDKNLLSYTPRILARKRSFVAQISEASLPFTTEEILTMGAEVGSSSILSKSEIFSEIQNVSKFFEISHLNKRIFSTLSGGEQQKVMLARAFAQSKEVMLLDEPDSSLDPGQSVDFFKKLSDAAKKNQSTVLVVTHNLDVIINFFPKMILIDNKSFKIGSPHEILYKYASKVFNAQIFTGEMSKIGKYALIR